MSGLLCPFSGTLPQPSAATKGPSQTWAGWLWGRPKPAGLTRPRCGERRLSGRQSRPCALPSVLGRKTDWPQPGLVGRTPDSHIENHATTHWSGQTKESYARSVAERDGVTEGLICVLSIVEPVWSFDCKPDPSTHRLEVRRRRRKCVHHYLYLVDPEFGFMHICIQAWLPTPFRSG